MICVEIQIVIPDQYYYLTCHRQENTFDDQPLLEILRAMNSLKLTTISAGQSEEPGTGRKALQRISV